MNKQLNMYQFWKCIGDNKPCILRGRRMLIIFVIMTINNFSIFMYFLSQACKEHLFVHVLIFHHIHDYGKSTLHVFSLEHVELKIN